MCTFLWLCMLHYSWTSAYLLTITTAVPTVTSQLELHDEACHPGGHCWGINTLRPRQDGRRFPNDTFKRIFLKENVIILIKISLTFVPNGPIDNITALVQIMAWRRPGDKPLSEPMMVCLLTHICVTRPQWVKLIPTHFVKSLKPIWNTLHPKKHTWTYFTYDSSIVIQIRWKCWFSLNWILPKRSLRNITLGISK